MDEQSLRVYSIFPSIDGECNHYGQGALTIFIRLAGCNLNCQYPCDTQNSLSFGAGLPMTVDQIMEAIKVLPPIKKVTITGGEPLLQMKGLIGLCARLAADGYHISVESNGSIVPTKELVAWVDCFVMDYKLPSSGEESKMKMEAFVGLTSQDYCKFVIMDRVDFDRALVVGKILEITPIKLAYSPVWGKMDPNLLLKWLLNAGLEQGILNLQLHKIINLIEPQ